MAETLLVAGTASHVGKSTVAAGLCRLLARRGVAVAPYKAQNMSNNARVVATPDGDPGEIGVSQHTQARAADVTPTTDVNPVLLKPRGAGESQLILQGDAVGHYEAGTYYEEHWATARDAAVDSYERLAREHDVIVAEGAGSIAEINLHDRDLANLETARFADADILLLVDIERGGAFASLYGTLELLPDDIRERVVGAAITKFRGDPALLDAGVNEVESRTGVPVLGVLPYEDPGLPAEDSLSLPDAGEHATLGDDDVPAERSITVAVPRLPHISNFTDLEPLAAEPGVRVRYLPLDASLADADAVVLPGTKNTVDDRIALRDAGFDDALRGFDGPVVGLCGGYQLLGQRLTNADIEGTGDSDTLPGLGLLPVETRFRPDKHLERTTVTVDGTGPIAGATGTATGYEIHMGHTTPTGTDSSAEPSRTGTLSAGESSDAGDLAHPLGEQSAATDRVLGTYLHGLFENENVRTAFRDAVYDHADTRPPETEASPGDAFERAADLVETNLDLDRLGLRHLL
ncbi:cobyric acid synthase [Halocalculus aciditolerans]|uniref:Probable cobyric acid synthase n=1 Tax=Halocalculus aciditolerans TaxID=1383812 RepID=A0A830FDW3_9EURY|nr:cobyric acid synthase [Halocalculus aciditolerans]GGL65718.1 cobyric acid synthase CobQ [Halocalculus aciditolerans]